MIKLFDVYDPNKYIPINEEINQIRKETKSFQHGHYNIDYPWIITNIPKGVKTVADVGGGLGALQFYLVNKYQVTNIDRLPYGPSVYENDRRIEYLQTDLGDTSIKYKPELYDCVISCSAIEHNLPAYFMNCLKHMNQIVKKGGLIIVTLPFTKKQEVRNNMITMTKEIIKNVTKELNMKLLTDDEYTEEDFDKKLIEFKDRKFDFVPGGVIWVKN